MRRTDSGDAAGSNWLLSVIVTEPQFLRDTRASYDILAEDYAEWARPELAVKPLDRAMLGGFAELVHAAGSGPVADIGCGPGRITVHLAELGLSAFGIDLSPAMVAVARRSYPRLWFGVGSMTALGLADGKLGGVVAWYSIIHVPRRLLPDVMAELNRVLAPGGYLQLAFQVGDGLLHLDDALQHRISLDFYRLRMDDASALLTQAGFDVRATMLREPDDNPAFPERTPQGFVLARKHGSRG
ncbi:methylase involved in ubiquinone/menaquinone biosynthesis [Saccharomonospora marina XMU15]|uniref:Methylase involved in ubiquinone/menaquinone biosynthesis n=1 Tax=Saccharomonospora marina XMU15 TaxID=882083 RepID=H5X4R4_9PSEU|nr:methylase involved in ubiquinone/menaquinone biosynthesis [Saccharomonospora marina XMU15]